jgi:spore maturation protein CgeB
MRLVLFCHSLVSDWNHGNAHFLRGVVRELLSRGHDVRVLEPHDGWSRAQLFAERGAAALERFAQRFPGLSSETYDLARLDLERTLDQADAVIVHEWSDRELVRRIGAHRGAGGRYALLFHDTHHRSVTAPEEIAAYDLRHYDAVLAFGEVIRERYARAARTRAAFTWHEAADVRLFRPLPETTKAGDLVWIGNWGDDERTAELHEFLLRPAQALGLAATVHGVRYPDEARAALEASGLRYGGWLPNDEVPRAFAQNRVTVHVPRRPYVEALPGVPTIRVFEALACGIPLLCSPWRDVEGLFRAGEDYLVAGSGDEMVSLLRDVLSDGALAASLSRSGRETVLARHTCAHRVDELLKILAGLGVRMNSP